MTLPQYSMRMTVNLVLGIVLCPHRRLRDQHATEFMLRNALVDPSQRRHRHRRNRTPEGFRSRPRRLLDRIQIST